MPKHLFKRYMPDPKVVREHKYLRFLARFLHDPNLFHMNRRSVSGAFAAGLFWAMIPMPMQMVAAAITAIVIRINLPISVALVWLTNPFTMPPVFYLNYRVGTWILGAPPDVGEFQMSLEWIAGQLDAIWVPLYFGSTVVGIVFGLLGYVGIRAFWRWQVIQRYRKRSVTSR